MVKSDSDSQDDILNNFSDGNFYSSTGVYISDLFIDKNEISFDIDLDPKQIHILSPKITDQEFNQRYAHALTDMKGAISTIDYTLFSETETDSADDDLSINAGKYSYSKEQFLEMGLTTSERLKNLTSKTLLIKNIYSQRANLNMLMNGQMFGFALMNFKGDFDLTKK